MATFIRLTCDKPNDIIVQTANILFAQPCRQAVQNQFGEQVTTEILLSNGGTLLVMETTQEIHTAILAHEPKEPSNG